MAAVAASVYEFQEAFAYFDADRDGRVTAPELVELLRALGHVATASELGHLVATVTRIYGGFLSFPQFVKVYTGHVEPRIHAAPAYAGTVEEAVREFASLCRGRKDGAVTLADVQTLLARVGDKVDDLSLLELLKSLQPSSAGAPSRDGGWSVRGPGARVVLLPSPALRRGGGGGGGGAAREHSPAIAIKDLVGRVLAPRQAV